METCLDLAIIHPDYPNQMHVSAVVDQQGSDTSDTPEAEPMLDCTVSNKQITRQDLINEYPDVDPNEIRLCIDLSRLNKFYQKRVIHINDAV